MYIGIHFTSAVLLLQTSLSLINYLESKQHPKSLMALSLFGGGRRGNIFDPFTLDIWDPFESISQSLSPAVSDRPATVVANVRVDWRETPEAHILKADLPGLKKEEVKVEVEDNGVLKISGEISREKEEKEGDKWHRVERSRGKFVRRFRLPENSKVNEIKATMENGVLSVVVPKEQEKQPEVRSIEVAG